ncbi:MAG: DsrE family protein [Streptosporangiaceae bacterium]
MSAGAAGAGAAGAGAAGGVVVHLDEEGGAKHQSVLRNVANLAADLGDQTAVELVAHGPGIGLCLADSPEAEDLQELIGRGVVAAACENTLKAKGIGRDRLAAGVVTVPSGIGELVRKQQQGWAYVRP